MAPWALLRCSDERPNSTEAGARVLYDFQLPQQYKKKAKDIHKAETNVDERIQPGRPVFEDADRIIVGRDGRSKSSIACTPDIY